MYEYLSVIDEKAAKLDAASDYIWDNPELAFSEFKSAACQMELLRSEGFKVEENLAGIATAFSGRFGSGKPVIGILGEFDALSGLGQVSQAPVKTPNGGENGHGCGHNYLGIGSIAAAMAVKKFLEDSGHEGTVIYYGCPGEEGGSGKAFMARDGVFDELDASLCWHPGQANGVRTGGSLANYQILYKFDGIAAHAGSSPAMGRSALDALELMNVGVQFLREHMSTDCRIHYAITDAGGRSPNVVQPHAEVLYLIRAPKNDQVKALYERVNKIAAGAAMMTETKESHDFIKACSNLVMNDTIQRVLQKKFEELGVPEPDEEDLAFARELAEKGLGDSPYCNKENPLDYKVKPYKEQFTQGFGSTDVGDASWVCPTAQVRGANWITGTPGHSWQVVTQGKTAWGHKVMRNIGKILAATAVELITDPELLAKAQEEFRQKVGPKGYEAPIPKDVRPKAITAL